MSTDSENPNKETEQETNEHLFSSRDIFGMEKKDYSNASTYTTLDKVLNWRIILLIVIIILGLYLMIRNYDSTDELKAPADNTPVLSPTE